jgi:hypothetical protein
MPKGTKVHKVYTALREEGMSKGKAARIAQSKTGQALATGKPPKRKKVRVTRAGRNRLRAS